MCRSLNIKALVQACAVLYVLRVSIFGFGKCFVLTQSTDDARLYQTWLVLACWVCQIVSCLSITVCKMFHFQSDSCVSDFFVILIKYYTL